VPDFVEPVGTGWNLGRPHRDARLEKVLTCRRLAVQERYSQAPRSPSRENAKCDCGLPRAVVIELGCEQASADDHEVGTVIAVFQTVEGGFRYAVDTEGYGALQFFTEEKLVVHR